MYDIGVHLNRTIHECLQEFSGFSSMKIFTVSYKPRSDYESFVNVKLLHAPVSTKTRTHHTFERQ